MKKPPLSIVISMLSIVMSVSLLIGCEKAADVASRNLSTSGDNFELNRAFHFLNTRTDRELMRIEGLCAKDNESTANTLIVTCKVGPNSFKKHYLGLSMNTSYFIEQLEPAEASVYHYRVLFAPSTLIPAPELR